eukprot:990038-Rhodomonas_salina.1
MLYLHGSHAVKGGVKGGSKGWSKGWSKAGLKRPALASASILSRSAMVARPLFDTNTCTPAPAPRCQPARAARRGGDGGGMADQ